MQSNNMLREAYYHNNIGIVQERIEKGGIRLAGLLNVIFSKNPMLPLHNVYRPNPVNEQATSVSLSEVSKHMGQVVNVSVKVYGSKTLPNMVLVNLGAEYPNQLLTVVLKGTAKELADNIDGKEITVNGTVVDYKGKPEIVISNPESIHYIK